MCQLCITMKTTPFHLTPIITLTLTDSYTAPKPINPIKATHIDMYMGKWGGGGGGKGG